MTKQKSKKKYLLIASVVLALALIISLAVGLTNAKYKTEKRMTANVRFTAELAKSMEIKEHDAVRATDGSYGLNTAKPVDDNKYVLMPGVDVPKDPYITIGGKTDIPAYLYVEVIAGKYIKEYAAPAAESESGQNSEVEDEPTAESELPVYIEYYVDPAKWVKLDIQLLSGGDLYVYSDANGNPIEITSANAPDINTEFYVLTTVPGATGNLKVSDRLPHDLNEVQLGDLVFYAYLCQKVTGNAATDFNRSASTAGEATHAPVVTAGN